MVNIKRNYKSTITVLSLLLLAVLSVLFLGNEKYMLIASIGAIISCIPFFSLFNAKKHSTREIITIAVMIALSISGRLIFTSIQHFKPVTAMVIITGMYFGADAGFVTGAFTPLLSNMYYGQGPWTVFQMAVWGIIGYTAGIINSKGILKNKILLFVFSFISGIVYSLIMDIYTTISVESGFSFVRYITYVTFSLPVMAEYSVSNVIFIFLMIKPLGSKLERVKTKYGLFI